MENNKSKNIRKVQREVYALKSQFGKLLRSIKSTEGSLSLLQSEKIPQRRVEMDALKERNLQMGNRLGLLEEEVGGLRSVYGDLRRRKIRMMRKREEEEDFEEEEEEEREGLLELKKRIERVEEKKRSGFMGFLRSFSPGEDKMMEFVEVMDEKQKMKKKMKKKEFYWEKKIREWSKNDYVRWLRDIRLFDAFVTKFRMFKISSTVGLRKMIHSRKCFENISERNKFLLVINVMNLVRLERNEEFYMNEFSSVLYKLSFYRDFTNIQNSWKDIINFIRSYFMNKKRICDMLKSATKKKNKINVNFIVTDDSFSNFKGCSLRELMDRSIRKEKMELKPPKSKKLWSGLVIDNWLLQFGMNGLIVPNRISLKYQCCFRMATISVEEYLENLEKVVDIICFYNWHVLRSELQDSSKLNCQTFVDDVIENFSFAGDFTENMLSYFERIRENGFTRIIPIQLKDVWKWNFSEVEEWLSIVDLKIKNIIEVMKDLNLNGKELLKIGRQYFSKDEKKRMNLEVITVEELLKRCCLDIEDRLKLKFCLCNLDRTVFKRKSKFDESTIKVVYKLIEMNKKKENEKEEENEKNSWMNNVDRDILRQVEIDAYLRTNTNLLYLRGFSLPSNEYIKRKRMSVKLVVVEIQEQLHPLPLQALSKFLDFVQYFKKYDYGFFHTALIIGPWYIEYFNSELVKIRNPKKVESERAVITLDLSPLEMDVFDDINEGRWLDKIKRKLVSVIYEYNVRKHYSRKNVNCVHFVDDVLRKLNISREVEEGNCLHQYISEIRRSGRSDMFISLSKKFLQDFSEIFYGSKDKKRTKFQKYPITDRIEFRTHLELDEFVNSLLCTNVLQRSLKTLEKRFPYECKLLKGFDRAFWLRHFKERNNRKYLPLVEKKDVSFSSLGMVNSSCPFGHPKVTLSFPQSPLSLPQSPKNKKNN